MAKSYGLDKIAEKKLLLVEGIDDALFFDQFLKHLGKNGVQIVQAKGRDIFLKVLKLIKRAQGFEELESLGLVRDADQSPDSARQSLRQILENEQFVSPEASGGRHSEGPPAVSLYILPDDESEGSLESLLYRCIAEPERICISQCIECANRIHEVSDSAVDKARIYVHLGIGPLMPDSEVSNLGRRRIRPGLRIGEAVSRGAWDWDSQPLDPLAAFLKSL